MAEWTECLAFDCKIVAGVLNGRWRHQLARVSVVNEFDQCVYSTYVKPSNGISNVFHIKSKAPMDAIFQNKVINGRDYGIVRREVKNMIKERILVGHAFEKDLRILRLRHPQINKRDAADYFGDPTFHIVKTGISMKAATKFRLIPRVFIRVSDRDALPPRCVVHYALPLGMSRNLVGVFTDSAEDDERPTLRDLAASELDMNLKDGPHDTTQAAVASMRLYKLHEDEWDQYIEDNYEEDSSSSDSS